MALGAAQRPHHGLRQHPKPQPKPHPKPEIPHHEKTASDAGAASARRPRAAAHRTAARTGLALHARRCARICPQRLRRLLVAGGHRTPRLGHLRPLQRRQRPPAHGHRPGRPDSGDGACRPHGRPALCRHGVVPAPLHDARTARRGPLYDALRRRDEPRPGLRQRPRGHLLAQRLQRLPRRHHPLPPSRRGEPAGRAARESARVVALVPRRRTAAQRPSAHHGRSLHPGLGNANHHARHRRRPRPRTAADRGGAARGADAGRLYARNGAAQRRGRGRRLGAHRRHALRQPRRRAGVHRRAPRAVEPRNAGTLHLRHTALRG